MAELTPSQIIEKINAWVTTNGNMQNTGAHLNIILNAIMKYVGVGYAFMGEAPSSAPSPDVPVLYFAGPGSYTGYASSAVDVPDGSIALLTFNGSAWSPDVIKVVEPVSVSQNMETGKTLAKVIIGEMEHDINAEELDDTPTPEHSNGVTSGGVAQSLADIYQTNIIDSKNLLNIGTKNTGYYVYDNGGLAPNSNYNASDYIPVEDGAEYTFQTGGPFASTRTRRTINQIAGYDKNKAFVSGSYATYGNSYIVPNGVQFIRFSADAPYLSAGNLPSFVKGTTVIDYFDYSENITVRTLRKNIIPQNVKDGVVFKFDINSNDFESDIEFQHMCANSISFNCIIDTFNEIRIGKGYQSYMGATLGIDNTNIYVYEGANTNPIITEPHGLTFKDYIGLVISMEYGNVAMLKLYTNGGSFTKPYFAWDARKGTFFVKSIGTNVLNHCTFGYYCYALEKPTWIYGDSYLTNAQGVTDRWPSYLIAGKHTNYLLNGYPGRGSAEALLSFKTDLNYGTPKRVIWCMGMNNADDGAVNPDWKSAVDELMEICRNNRIELILAKIPSTPTIVNSYKNAYVKKFDYRCIDFAGAVNIPNGSGNWYDDMLSSDNVHPAIQGAIALYQQTVCDVPELIS